MLKRNNPRQVKTESLAEVWFYENRASIDIYVRPMRENGDSILPEPVKFLIYKRWIKDESESA